MVSKLELLGVLENGLEELKVIAGLVKGMDEKFYRERVRYKRDGCLFYPSHFMWGIVGMDYYITLERGICCGVCVDCAFGVFIRERRKRFGFSDCFCVAEEVGSVGKFWFFGPAVSWSKKIKRGELYGCFHNACEFYIQMVSVLREELFLGGGGRIIRKNGNCPYKYRGECLRRDCFCNWKGCEL